MNRSDGRLMSPAPASHFIFYLNHRALPYTYFNFKVPETTVATFAPSKALKDQINGRTP